MSKNKTEEKKYTPQENKGALFPNNNKVRSEQPDYSGVLFIPALGGKIDIFGYSNTSKNQKIDYINLVSKEGELRGFLTSNPKFKPENDKSPDWFGKLSLSLHGVVEVSGWTAISKDSRMNYLSLSVRHYLSTAEIDKWVEDTVMALKEEKPNSSQIDKPKTVTPTPVQTRAENSSGHAFEQLRALQESLRNN